MAEEKAAADKKTKLPKGRHRSAIKRHRQNLKRAEQNRTVHSTLRTAIKKVKQAVEAKDTALAQTSLRTAMSLLHKAGQKGMIHRGNASRHIGRLSSLVSSLSKKAA
jgi:small subunit ribosomal protein S20